jgi:hypothetical protein
LLAGRRVNNPRFYAELIQMGFARADLPDFAHMAAITFVDTVVSHELFTDRLLFHELVHVVQYAKLCLPEFVANYVKGFLRRGSIRGHPSSGAWFRLGRGQIFCSGSPSPTSILEGKDFPKGFLTIWAPGGTAAFPMMMGKCV